MSANNNLPSGLPDAGGFIPKSKLIEPIEQINNQLNPLTNSSVAVPSDSLGSLQAGTMTQTVLKLAWPVIIQNLLMTMTMYVDTIMLGQVGETAVAAMGVNRPLLMAVRIVLMSISVGTLAIVARAYGGNDPARVARQAAASLIVAVIIGISVSLTGFFLAEPLIGIYVNQADYPELYYHAVMYYRITISAFFSSYIFLVGSTIFRACGNTTTPMLIAIYVNIFNVFGNYCLIYGNLGCPALGVEGAALSSALADIIEGVLFCFIVFSKRSCVPLKLRHFFEVKWSSLKTLFRVSLPAVVEPLVIQAGMLVLYKIITSLGPTAIASHQIVLSIESLSFMPGMGLSIACGALVGQYLGAKRVDLAETAYRTSLRLSLIVMTTMGVIFALFPGYLVRLFIDPKNSPDVVTLAATCLMIGAIEEPFIALAMAHQGTLRGAGDTKSSAWVAFIGVWLVRLPLVYLFVKVLGWGLVGVWAMMPVDWMVRAVAFRIMYLKGRWKTIHL